MLTVMLVTGTRRGAMARLCREDVHDARVCHDGIPRTSLAVHVGKTKPWHEIFHKPLPHPAGCVVRAWATYVARIAQGDVRPGGPLFIATLSRPEQTLDLEGTTQFFSGHVNKDNPKRSRRAAFPRFEDALGSIGRRGPYSERECTGYSPHALRHAHDQLVEHGGPAYLAALGEHRISPSVIVKATCNHEMSDDRYGYKDLSNPQGLERLCTMGSEIAWAVLTGRAGARMGLDREAIEAALRKRAAFEAETDRLAAVLRGARTDMERALSVDLGQMTAADFMRTQTLRSRIDLMWDERSELQEALRHVDRELEALQHDPARQVEIPDEAPDEAAVVDIAALQLAIDGTRAVGGRRVRRQREWLTPAEFAQVAGVSESEVKRWLDGTFSTRHRGPRPWGPEAVPVDWLSPRRRRILVAGVSADFLSVSGVADRLEKALATPGPDAYRRASTPR